MGIGLIIIIIILIAFKFLMDRDSQKDYIIKQGGMKNKYQLLIDKIIQSAPDLGIIEETNHDITLASEKNYAGQTTFTLTQAFRKLIVEWRVSTNSETIGNHKLKWEFDEFKDQDEIFKKINDDIGKYSKNIIGTVKVVNQRINTGSITDDEIPIEKVSEIDNEYLVLSNMKFIKAFEDKDNMLIWFVNYHRDSELTRLFAFNGEQFGATTEMLTDYTDKNREIGKDFFEFLEKEGVNTSNYEIF